ncbi:hypothetical protein FS749_016386 [Ceratobasidium sp. UAMH 11750]|nr:hypothetical protein FS749_016386 [Ceratobasidium sp. UAMH 11750]
MATGMDPAYDFLYSPSSSSIHQPHVPGADPSLATEIMPAPPPLTSFPRMNEKGQVLTRTGKISHKKKPPGLGAIMAHVGRPPKQRPIVPVEPVPAVVALTPEAVASPRAAPSTDLEPSVTVISNGTSPGTSLPPHAQPKRPRGKKSHPFTSRGPSPLATRDTGLAPTGVKPEPTDDPFISHTDLPPSLEAYDSPFASSGRFDGMQLGVHGTPGVKPTLSSRRKGKGKDTGLEAGDHEGDGYPQLNNVTCECCSLQGGHLVFCDGCPRSFHLLCLNPPLDELQEESWYCQSCTAKRNGLKPPPPKFRLETSTKRVNPNGLFDELMYHLACEPPKVFALPEDIRAHFKDVTASGSGAYMDSGDVVRERLRWMCPNHATHSVPKIRIPKSGSRVVTITKPGQRNNGNIEVIMDSEPVQLIPQVMRAAYEEVRINGQRYRVPEQTIVLDFWKKAKRNRMREVSRVSSPAPPPAIRPATPVRSSPGIATPSSSPLTSLSSLSDHEDDGLENVQPHQGHGMGDLAAAELLHAFHVQARSESSPNSLADDNFHTEHSINTRNSSPLSSILSDDAHEYNETVSSIFRGEAANSSLSPGPVISQAPRPSANGIKIIPKAGSFAIRIPASKAVARSVVREPSQPRRSDRHRLSSPQTDPTPSNLPNAKPTAYNTQEAAQGLNSSGPDADDDLSPAEIAKLKKIKALILAKGEEELLKFLRS